MRFGALGWVLLSGCVTAQVALPPEQVSSVERRFSGEERFLRLSMFTTPLFGDETKKLVSAVPPGQVRLLYGVNGEPVTPGKTEGIVTAGTLVRITKVEFPSSRVMAERVLYTPRTLVWLYLDVAGTPKGAPPSVLVLRPGLRTEEELTSEVERWLSREDPKRRLEQWPEAVRDAVKTKNAVNDMPADALEMAWGYPDRKKLELDGEKKRETWSWADGKRTAVLVDGRVTELH